MEQDRFNEVTEPIMVFLRRVYQDDLPEMLSLECVHSEEDTSILIDALEEVRINIDNMIRGLKEIQ